jgi:hypothetical protein
MWTDWSEEEHSDSRAREKKNTEDDWLCRIRRAIHPTNKGMDWIYQEQLRRNQSIWSWMGGVPAEHEGSGQAQGNGEWPDGRRGAKVAAAAARGDEGGGRMQLGSPTMQVADHRQLAHGPAHCPTCSVLCRSPMTHTFFSARAWAGPLRSLRIGQVTLACSVGSRMGHLERSELRSAPRACFQWAILSARGRV